MIHGRVEKTGSAAISAGARASRVSPQSHNFRVRVGSRFPDHPVEPSGERLPVAPAPEGGRQGLDAERREPREQGERKPGEPRPLGKKDEPRGTRAEPAIRSSPPAAM